MNNFLIKQHQFAGRITFITIDHVLIMERESDMTKWPPDIQDHILDADARERGVKIISTTRSGNDIICLVQWL